MKFAEVYKIIKLHSSQIIMLARKHSSSKKREESANYGHDL